MTTLVVDIRHQGMRLDAYLAGQLPALSRSRLRALIEDGCVACVPAADLRPRTPVRAGMTLTVEIPPPSPATLAPEPVPLDLLYEDHDLLVVNKPAGMVVHPAAGQADGTLVNALLHHCPDLPGINGCQRPGIVHRLDKDTSGAMIVAKSEAAMTALAAQFKARAIEKEYRALAAGVPSPRCGRIETLIGRDPRNRKKMAASPMPTGELPPSRGRRAVTRYSLLEPLGPASWLKLMIETGRTHQIRVHLAHIGHPVLGDATYGGRRARLTLNRPQTPFGSDDLKIGRHMLHAYRIAFQHPVRHQAMELIAPLPPDMNEALNALRDFFA